MSADYGVYLVTDTGQCGNRGVVETARQAVDGGVRVVQIRDKSADAATLLASVEAVASAVGDRASVLVNDRVDVYLVARRRGARVHGVHIGQNDLPAAETRALIGRDAILGLTANTRSHFEVVNALPAGIVDYLGVGAIRETATKPDHPEALGVTGFGRIARSLALPCVAVGGIGAADVKPLRECGAAGVAVVSAICMADNPRAAARRLQDEWAR